MTPLPKKKAEPCKVKSKRAKRRLQMVRPWVAHTKKPGPRTIRVEIRTGLGSGRLSFPGVVTHRGYIVWMTDRIKGGLKGQPLG